MPSVFDKANADDLLVTAEQTRPDQSEFGDENAAAYRNAVLKLVEDGTYREIVLIHADMSHNMHGSMGPVGVLRFLAWHRRYLMAFDEALKEADRALRPAAATPVSIPYWRWVDPFPAWLADFLPARHPQTGDPLPARKLAPPSSKPTAADILTIIEGFEQQLPGQDVDGYTRFTWGLEGNGRRPDGSRLPAHNQVHAWVGGIMNNTMFSPADPVFWLLHAEVDRLWHLWQLRHPDLHPALTGADRIMDPWPESYDDVSSIGALGYDYASVEP
ncbi:MAG: tyrosinase family protein [Acidobacteria bacterium]|nr:tyrosinase family protein [Acidobacteriota bacterium]